MNHHAPHEDKLDQATARRLSRLQEKPFDIEQLQQRIEEQIEQEEQPTTIQIRRWLSPVASLAAAVLLAVGIFFILSTGDSQTRADALDLTVLHEQLLTGELHLTSSHSVEEVNRRINEQLNSNPALPIDMQHARVQSCCLVNVQGELIALAVLNRGDTPLTLIVARAPKFAHKMGTVIEVDGKQYFGHELNGIPMMMANNEDRWLCVMGEASYEELAATAASITF